MKQIRGKEFEKQTFSDMFCTGPQLHKVNIQESLFAYTKVTATPATSIPDA